MNVVLLFVFVLEVGRDLLHILRCRCGAALQMRRGLYLYFGGYRYRYGCRYGNGRQRAVGYLFVFASVRYFLSYLFAGV